MREMAAAVPWSNDRIIWTTTRSIWELTERTALSWKLETICCWVIVHLHWNGPTKPLRFRMVSLAVWVFWLFFFLHVSGPTIHTICQGALNVVSKFWLCGGDMQPDDASAIGFMLVWGPSLWLGASRTLSGILVHRSVMRETGLWRWKDFAEIQIQPFHSSDVDPEFQGQERNSSRWHCDLVVGA